MSEPLTKHHIEAIEKNIERLRLRGDIFPRADMLCLLDEVRRLESELAAKEERIRELETELVETKSNIYKGLKYLESGDIKTAEINFATASITHSNWFGEQIANATYSGRCLADKAEAKLAEMEEKYETTMAIKQAVESQRDSLALQVAELRQAAELGLALVADALARLDEGDGR